MSEWMHVKVDADQFERAIRDLPRCFQNETMIAGSKIAKLVLGTEGVKKYPPLTTQKRDEGPGSRWYERGRGMAYRSQAGVSYSNTSEKYGTQWSHTVKPNEVRLKNAASYGWYLGGHKQPSRMKKFGWKKVTTVIRDKMSMIKSLYKAAIRRAVKRAGFRIR